MFIMRSTREQKDSGMVRSPALAAGGACSMAFPCLRLIAIHLFKLACRTPQ